ncbi:MAG: LysM peptidoglycan-binding domain-containing protein [Myxococcota bacterium]
MARRLFLFPLALALAACGESPSVSHRSVSDTAEVEALSDATVAQTEVDAPLIDLDDGSLDEPIVAETTVEELGTEPVIGSRYTLRRGESLAHFARWSELPVEDIAEASGLSLGEVLHVGTTVIVPVSGEDQLALERRRDDHRTARVTAYLESRGGAAFTEFHSVRTGETAWSIAKDSGSLPVWVIESYNPATDLENLRPGDSLLVPVIADVVVEAPEEPVVEFAEPTLQEPFEPQTIDAAP